jgi:hypothetical protein
VHPKIAGAGSRAEKTPTLEREREKFLDAKNFPGQKFSRPKIFPAKNFPGQKFSRENS